MRAALAPPGLRLSNEARGMIPWCVVLSISAHVLLLAGAGPSGPRLGGLPSTPRPAPERVRMTLVPVAVAPQPAGVATPTPTPTPTPAPDEPPAVLQSSASLTVAAAASAASAGESSSRGRLGASAAGASVAAAASSTASVPSAAASAAKAPPPRPAASAVPDPWTPGNPARGAYLPRPLLSIAPKIQTEVVIATPPGADDGARHVGVLSLFIDEQGRVRHIDPDDPALPPVLEEAAREAFMGARFLPGQVDGRAVKSRVNVEVAFESALTASPRATGASAAGSAASAQRSP